MVADLHRALRTWAGWAEDEVTGWGATTAGPDLTSVTFFDTSALGAIVDAHRLGCSTGATLVLCGLPGSVRRVLEITGLDRVLHLR